jgi:hypothetical protein
MARIMLAPALAFGALLAAAHVATAAEPDKALGGFTMTLGGKGTAAQAATAKDDTEEACCWRHHCCWGGGYGGYYGGGYYGGGYYGGGYSSYYGGQGGYGYSSYYSYAPAYYNSFAYRPYYNYQPYVNYYAGAGYRGGFGGNYYAVNGTSVDATAPVTSLALATAKNPVAAANSIPLRYNGGPANPVPQVKPDAEPRAAAAAPGLPVSFKKETASPYRYKAYGEK